MKRWIVFLALSSCSVQAFRGAQPSKRTDMRADTWTFALSGDSRNCGDLIMPVIARRAKAAGARFYWHLGDLRALYKVDEDYAGLHKNDPAALTMDVYLKDAWKDFREHQVIPFAGTPFFLGIGNHELINRTRDDFVAEFQDLLNIDPIREGREAGDHTVRSYYHWRQAGVDFLNLDNAANTFDDEQIAWALKVIAAAESDPVAKMLVVGMHESLPDSYSLDHSMNTGADKGESGRVVYNRLLEFRQKSGKPVYVFSSHSHYYLANLYNTGAWQSNGGVLPGWLVGTAGAQHYAVPPEVKSFTTWAENEYGYVTVQVTPSTGALAVKFVPVKKMDIPVSLVRQFGRDTVDFCFSGNWRATLHESPY